MTLMGNTADVYAPGEQGTQGLPPSRFQNVNLLGRYNLQGLASTNVWLGAAGVVVVLWLTRKYLGGGR